MKWFLRILLSLLAAALMGVLSIAVINRYVHSSNSGRIKTSITEVQSEEPKRVAIVFEARVFAEGRLTNSLYDRVLTGVELYRAERVKKLLMTGDGKNDSYDEPAAMKKLALELGVAESDIVLDNDGKRTYDSCYRAKEIFEIQKLFSSRMIITSRVRSICAAVWELTASASRQNAELTTARTYYRFREFFSAASAWFEINLLPFEVAKGQKQPIRQ